MTYISLVGSAVLVMVVYAVFNCVFVILSGIDVLVEVAVTMIEPGVDRVKVSV